MRNLPKLSVDAGFLLVSFQILNGNFGVGHHRLVLVADRAADSASRV